jgi:SAM-dependent methyltransferase
VNTQSMLGFDRNVDEVERDFGGLLQTVPNNLTCYATHGFHYYPAKFIPQFPGFFIQRFSEKGDLVVDPMCGAGTTLIEAALSGRRFFGCDIDPIAALISRVATTSFAGYGTRGDFERRVKSLLLKVWKELKSERLKKIVIPTEKEFPNALLWFREEVLRELILIRDIVLEEGESGLRDFGLLSLSSIIREVSNADPRDIFPQRDIDNPVRDRKNTLKEFENSVWEKFEKVVSFSQRVKNKRLGEIKCADAREIGLEDGIAQLVFTSPPYAYAIDYARVQQLSTLLLCMRNEEFKEYRRKYVGTDRVSTRTELDSYEGIEFAQKELKKVLDTDRKCGLVLYQYFKDMYLITQECHRILMADGYLIYVVGNSTIRRTTFQTNEVFKKICESLGFEIERVFERPYYIYRMSRKRNTHSNTVKSDFFIVAKKR